jgi:hypothetical protein
MGVQITECKFVSRYRTETSYLVRLAGVKEQISVTLYDDPTADNHGFGPHKIRTVGTANTVDNADEIAAAVLALKA